MGVYENLPYTNFHETNLEWTINTAKKAGEDAAEALETSNNTKEYVYEYFETLNVQDQIDTKIDEMAADGSLNDILDPVTEQAVAQWLEDNIGPTTPPVDASLTVSGAAADAAVVGDEFKKTLIARGTLTDTDDLNLIADPGTYYIAAGSIPANAPVESAGRMLIIKSYQNSYAIDAQLYFTDNSVYYRVSRNEADIATTWDGVSWNTIVDSTSFDDVMLQRATLTSADDCNALLSPGMYTIDSGSGFPSNLPYDPHNGKLLVFSRSVTSASNCIQIYMQRYTKQRMFIRISKSLSDPSDAWDGVSWDEVMTVDTIADIESLSGDIVKIPLTRGAMQSNGRYSGVSQTRMRVLNSYHDLTGFQLAGYKIKFYYYTSPYDYDEATASQNPTNFLYTRPWQDIDEPVNPDPGSWFTFMIAKQGDANISNSEIPYIMENLIIHGKKDDQITMQVQPVPPTALDYHDLWTPLLDGERVKRISLGNVNNDANYPIYAYEIHTQRNYMNGNYQNINYNGSNAVYPRKKVLIFSGTHGNEKCTPMDVYTLAKELISGSMQDIGAMFDWYIIPITNPWGYSHVNLDSNGNIIYRYGTVASTIAATWDKNAGVRTNASGMDINRDFSDVTYTEDGVTYGWQTPEAQIMQSYILANNWDVFIDVHQNNQDKYDAMPHMFAMAGVAWNASTPSATLNKLYQVIDQACKMTVQGLDEYFRRSSDRVDSMVIWQRYSCDSASSSRGVATNYLGGYAVAGTGNTLHTDIAAEVPMTIETSELAWTYSQLSNQTNTPAVSWYNEIACTCSTTAVVNLVKAVAAAYQY